MTQTKNNTDSHKGEHLSYAECCQIAVLKKGKTHQPSGCGWLKSSTINNYTIETPSTERKNV